MIAIFCVFICTHKHYDEPIPNPRSRAGCRNKLNAAIYNIDKTDKTKEKSEKESI